MAIKRPGNGRATYAIIIKGKTVYDERIDAVNRDVILGHAPDELVARMREIEKSFRPQSPLLGYTNYRLAEECFAYKVKYTPLARLRSPYTAHRRLIRGVEALDQLPLTTATADQILEQIAHTKDQPGRRYHVLGAINELLRYLRRDLRLPNPSPRIETINFIEVGTFLERSKLLREDYAIYLGSLFATGMRLGELPMATYPGNTFYVNQQLHRDGRVGPMKCRTEKQGPMIPHLIPFVMRLNALGRDAVHRIRRKYDKMMLNASKDILGVTIHDMRHSYAIYMAKQSRPTGKIAEYIGDSEEVCRKHYSRYRPTNEELEDVFKHLK